MRNTLRYPWPAGQNEQQFMRKLAAQFAIKKEPLISEGFTIYDTFDWRLFNKSLVLYGSGSKLCLRELARNEIMLSSETSFEPVFIRDFPDGELKAQLAPIIKMRALLPLAKLHIRSTAYRMLNQDEKTVAHLTFEEIRLSPNKDAPVLGTYLWLTPVRGYFKYSQILARQLEEAGLTKSKSEDIFFKALEFAGKKPGSYSAKVNIKLDPHMRSDDAIKVILRFLLQVIRINEAYLDKDIDTEFLHDFRVAIRRTRSALGQIKHVFPAKATDRFKNDFAFVHKFSNELRDLDVYLLKEDTYKAMLPNVLRYGIDPLFEHLRQKRSKALQKAISALKSKKYAKILQDWEIFLDNQKQKAATAANAEVPVIDLARKRIYKKYRSVVKAGSSISEKAEDQMLHVLRIHCKKLRYLIEFFSSLFPHRKINLLIEHLKKLQDNLGDFNDLCIQEEYLMNIAKELPAGHRQFKNTLIAIGSLIGTLDRERQIVRDSFTRTFTDFASPAIKKLFRELFVAKAQERVS